METSIKIVEGGNKLTLTVKRIGLKGASLTSAQLQTVCTAIGKRYRIPAAPDPNSAKQEIFIPAYFHLPVNSFQVSEWIITPSDVLETLTLSYTTNTSKQLMGDLYKRGLLLSCKDLFWTLDSPRILYEKNRFAAMDGIAVVRRFEVSEVLLDEGLGFSIGLTTSFFSIKSVLDFFRSGNTSKFDSITSRQHEQQGTLLYKGPNGNSKCYFVKFGNEKTLSTTPSFTEAGKDYANSYEYYKTKYPNYQVNPTDQVALVSFPGMSKQVYVAAKNLFPRIFNTALEGELQNIDKIGTDEKRKYLESNFWQKIGIKAFGNGFSNISSAFFTPPDDKWGVIGLPGIIAGKNKLVPAPASMASKPYRDHFKNRKTFLDKYGCYHIPATLSGSKFYFAFPDTISDELQQRYSNDLISYIKKITRNEVEFDVTILPAYQNYLNPIVSLKRDHENGMVIFAFDDSNPAMYSFIEYELKGWNIKRATIGEMKRKYNQLEKASRTIGKEQAFEKAKKNWDSYIEMTALKVIQKLGCIPFVVQPDVFNYDMQVIIDVSEDYSHFCISGLFYNEQMPYPLLPCHTERKTDDKQETINPVILKDEIVKMFTAFKRQISKYAAKKYLFARDGKDCGEEFTAIRDAFEQLKKDDVLSDDATFDFVEYHKTTRKEVRLWDIMPADTAVNVLEGTFYFFRSNIAILCTTGDGTLSNRITADPITIVNKYTSANILHVLEDIFYGAQFNFSSPRVAQKHSLPMKRADDELAEKRAQEIKRLK